MVAHACNLRLSGAWVRKGMSQDLPGLPRELKNSLGKLSQTIKKNKTGYLSVCGGGMRFSVRVVVLACKGLVIQSSGLGVGCRNKDCIQ